MNSTQEREKDWSVEGLGGGAYSLTLGSVWHAEMESHLESKQIMNLSHIIHL